MKKYQLADLVNGGFGEAFNCLEQAEKSLKECIAEGNKFNFNHYQMYLDAGTTLPKAEDFIFIIELYKWE